ncbi:hypothetical protein BC835DRAFT_1280048 [Cytidiella melzeri]|nr:hypothetical protein BC835DRAFT_1280048 [Cytidiella melzeri]
MPTIPVNKDGAVLYYEDSGAPEGALDYSTIIITHGLLFHGAVFRPLFAHASAQNLRIVVVNQRDYPGSSLLNEPELARVLSQEPEEQAAALRGQGVELATFIAHFIEAEKVPVPTVVDGKDVGGISFLAWSQGNSVLLSFLSNISLLDAHTSTLLERYMPRYFYADPPSWVLGYPTPPGLTTPIHGPLSVEVSEKAKKFGECVGTYYNPLEEHDITVDALLNRYDMHSATGEAKYLCTTSRIPNSELDALIAPEIFPRAGVALAFASEVYDECFQRALCDTEGRWSHLRVVSIWPNMSVWPCTLAGKVMADRMTSPPTKWKVRRDVDRVWIKGANHFFHYEEPDKFLHVLASYV